MKLNKRLHFFPRQRADQIAFTFTLAIIHLVCLYEVTVIIPRIDSGMGFLFWIHILIGLVLYINIMSCYVLTILTDTSTGTAVLPTILKQGWRYCAACESNSPPRSHHCWTCDVCILLRDHHCVFTGTCIGHWNQRYYTSLIINLALAAFYCNVLNLDYAWEVLGGFSPTSLFTMVLPMLAWVLGLAGTYTFAVAFISSLCLLGFCLLTALLGYHFLNILHGQTTHERGRRDRTYDMGWKENVRAIFGDKWFLAWFFPFVPSNLPGDGIEFPRRGLPRNTKDL